MTTEERIIQTAKKVFYTNGFQKTTARMLAKECGIDHSSMYYYFNTMNDIAYKIMQEVVEITRKVVWDLNENFSPIELYIAYSLVGINHIHKDKKFADFCFELPELLSDAIYEYLAKEIFPELNIEAKISGNQKVYDYLNMHAIIKSEINALDLIKRKELPLNPEEATEYIMLIKKRIMNIDDDLFYKAKTKAEELEKKVDYSKLNIFTD